MMRATATNESPLEVLALFTISMIASAMAYAGVGALIPYIATGFDLSRGTLGLAALAMALGGVLTASISGSLVDRFGDRAAVRWSGYVMAAGMIAAAAIHNYAWLLCCLFVYGIGFAASNPAGTHAILFFFPKERRGFAMGVRQTGVPLGGVAGALVFSQIGAHAGYRAALVAAGLLILAITSLAATLYHEPAAIHGERVSVTVLLRDVIFMARDPRLLLVTGASMLLFFGQTAVIAYIPITLVHLAFYNPEAAAIVFACASLAGAAARVIAGRASDRVFAGNRMVPMAIMAAIAAVACLGFARIENSQPIAVVGTALLLGAAGEGWFGLLIIALAEIGGEEHAGGALGFGLTFTFLSGVIAPLTLGSIAQRYGYSAAWTLTAIVVLAAIVPALLANRLHAVGLHTATEHR